MLDYISAIICTILFGNDLFPLLFSSEVASSLKAGTLSYLLLCPMPGIAAGLYIAGAQQMSALSRFRSVMRVPSRGCGSAWDGMQKQGNSGGGTRMRTPDLPK